MAITLTSLATPSTSTSQASSYAGTAGTPAAGDLLICAALVSDSTATGTMSGTFTWTKLTSFTKNGGLDTLYVFYAYADTATSTTPTVDVTGDNGTGAILHCWRVTGAQGRIQPSIRQMKTATGTSANPAVTMDRAILTTNAVISFAANGTNSTTQWTNPTGWIADVENAFNTPTNGMASSGRASGETGTTITWTNANTTAWGVIVLELWLPSSRSIGGGGAYSSPMGY